MSTTTPPESIDSHRVARGLGSTVLARMGAVVELVAQPLYVLMFGLAGYGLYAVLWSTVNLIENICDLGMTSAMQRTVPKAATDAEAAEALRTALMFGVGPCLIVAGAISAFAYQIAPLINVAVSDEALVGPAIRLFIWTLPLWAFVEIGFAGILAIMLIYLILGENSGVFVLSVADNVMKFANAVPTPSLIGLAVILGLSYLIMNRLR